MRLSSLSIICTFYFAWAQAILNETAQKQLVDKNFHGINVDLIKQELNNYRKNIGRVKREEPFDDIEVVNVEPPETHRIIDINEGLNDYLYQGDIILTEDQMQSLREQKVIDKRQAYKDKNYPRYRWDDGVPYYFHSSINEKTRSLIKMAIAYWEANTCIRFKENGSGLNRIRFFKGDGCFSFVGKVTKLPEQDVSIGQGCENVGIIAHEVGHALGFFHEHSRHDRDNYISIDFSNLQEGFKDQYQKETSERNENFGVSYDYGSIMTYSDKDSAADKTKTVVNAPDKQYQRTMGQRIYPTFRDLLVMNKLYECNSCGSNNGCERGGFPNPNNCGVCICPWGFGGDKCNRRADSVNTASPCGDTYTATSDWKAIKGEVGDSTTEKKDQFASCHWHIKAPSGQKIEVKIVAIGASCSAGCFWSNIEIKTKSDFTGTGYRYCCTEDGDLRILKSESDTVVISAYSIYNKAYFNVLYRAVP